MVVPPNMTRWSTSLPPVGVTGGAGPASDQQLQAIRQDAERFMQSYVPAAARVEGASQPVQALATPTLPPAPVLPQVALPTLPALNMPALPNLNELFEKVKASTGKVFDWLRPAPQPQQPSFALPGLEDALRDLNALPQLPPVPAPAPKPEPKPEPKPAPKPEPKPDPGPGGTYTVKKGDSLSLIAKRVLGDTNRWREIYELNKNVIANPNVIHAGMVLRLPGKGVKPAPAPAPAPSSPTPGGHPHNSRNSWYISQYKSKFNTNEDVPGYDNGNCGPTSVTMVAKAFGKINPGPAQADAAIEESRRRMGDGMNERAGTSVAGLARATNSYGLNTRTLWNASSSTIAKELSQGRLVIVHGTVIKDDGRTYGGHYYVVTKIENGKAYLSDPAYPSGPRVISTSLLDKSIRTRGTHAMVSVGP